jgi:hypothetical protein
MIVLTLRGKDVYPSDTKYPNTFFIEATRRGWYTGNIVPYGEPQRMYLIEHMLHPVMEEGAEIEPGYISLCTATPH